MSKHSAKRVPDLMTGTIPIGVEVRTTKLADRLEELLGELETWKDLNLRWGHINDLIGAINDVYWLLGQDKHVQLEVGLL